MALSDDRLRRELREAGIANAAINAVWPEWWSADAANSTSATAELTYTVARRLGLSPRALFEGSAQFLWQDDTKFKNLGTSTARDQAILAAFGIAIGRCALGAVKPPASSRLPDVNTLRQTILGQGRLVDAFELLTFCWSFGIPVIQLRFFPLQQKRMHAMTVRVEDRYAILLGFDSKFFSRVAYILAHEIGHILLGHLDQENSLLEIDDPIESRDPDDEEVAADRLALMLLTGSESISIAADTASYTASQLADAAISTGRERGIDPGALALCLGHATGKWRQSLGALKIIPPGEQNVSKRINDIASAQFDWQALSYANQEYLARVIGHDDES